MLQSLLNFQDLPIFLDATDAVAVALCHFFQSGNSAEGLSKQYTGWDAFIKDNDNRVKK